MTLSPRVATVLLHIPTEVTDQNVADRLWRLLRGEIRGTDPRVLLPDPGTLEVHVRTVSVAEDAFCRASLIGPSAGSRS